MTETRKVHKSGGSAVVSLPAEARENANMDVGATVTVAVEDDEVRLKTVVPAEG